MKTLLKTSVLTLVASLIATPSWAGDLIINFDDLNPVPKAAFKAAVEAFEAAHPSIKVTVNNLGREPHKTAINTFLLNDAPDVTSWYPGNRMAPYTDNGLFADISDLWVSDENLSNSFGAIKPTMTRDGKQWGVPYTYYQWGIYYRKDIFDKLSIQEPKTWDALLAASKTLKQNGITPFTIGTKFLWPAAGVFDYINLRTNGYDVHNDLMTGKIKYSDPRIRKTFENWAQLIDMGGFVPNHETMSWQDAVAPFANGDAAMYVAGSFSVAQYEADGLVNSQIDFFQFPQITPGLPRAEEAPADAFFIPKNAKNKEDARTFLAFIAKPEIQAEWNKALGQLPPNSQASIDRSDKFIMEGFKTVSNAANLTQFYDRDAPAVMAKAGMEGFQKFMLDTSKLDEILAELDRVQNEVY